MAAVTKWGTAIVECYRDGGKITLDVVEGGKVAGQERQPVATAQEEDVALDVVSHGLATWALNFLKMLQRNNFLIIIFAMKLPTVNFQIYFGRIIILLQVILIMVGYVELRWFARKTF